MSKRNLLFVFLFFAVLAFGCRFGGHGVRGNGHVVKESRHVAEFDKIDVSGFLPLLLKWAAKEIWLFRRKKI